VWRSRMKLISLFACIEIVGTPIGAAAAISIGVHGESTDMPTLTVPIYSVTGAAVMYIQIDASHADAYSSLRRPASSLRAVSAAQRGSVVRASREIPVHHV
jgi:hypothetical protein